MLLKRHSFNGWVIFHRTYVPHLLYPFICQWTFRLLPCLGHCKEHCNEHWGACILSNHVFLQIYAQEWECWLYSSSILFLKKLPYFFHSGCSNLHSPQQHARVSFSPHSQWYLLSIDSLMAAIQWGDILLWFWFLFPWMIRSVEHLSMCLLNISMSSLQKCLLMSFAH